MFYEFVEEKLPLVSRNPDVTAGFKTFKWLLVLCESNFAESFLQAYERLGLLSFSKPLGSILIYSNFHSCLPFSVWIPKYNPLP